MTSPTAPPLPVANIDACAAEPIRVPGAIQPHGWFAALHAAERRIAAFSANWDGLLGEPATAAGVEALLARLNLQFADLVNGEGPLSIGAHRLGDRWVHVSAHRAGEAIHLELEPDRGDQGAQAPIYHLARHVVPQMQRANSVDELCRVVAAEMKQLTQFGRCLVYRFDADGHGEVLAERRDDGYDSYLGHRFPASDIPAQARELYRLNHLRLIADAWYRPVPVLFADGSATALSLDLSQAQLRSVSPVHLEYMRNMGTAASMSVSIIVRNELWGLVSCHHAEPRTLSYALRMACEHLGQLLSLQIEAKEENEQVTEQARLRQLTLAMVAHLADSDPTLQRLVDDPAPLLRMARATGAAVIFNERCWTVGDTPPADQILAIGAWLTSRIDDVVATDSLGRDAPSLGSVAGAAGVLAISISKLHRHYVVWFRPEIVQTITWAGDPRKEPEPQARLHPRRSFASWVETVRGHTLKWRPAELHAAQELRQALLGIVLRRAEEMAEVAAELGRVNKELEAFSYTVSHDLRAPMRHIAGFVDLVVEMDGPQISERSGRYLQHVKQAAAHAGSLVDALLDFSRMGRMALKYASIDTGQMVRDIADSLARQHPERRIEWVIASPLPPLWGDSVLLQLAVNNLIGNAVKYSRTRAQARIEIRGIETAGETGLSVTDNGVGFPMKYVGKLFGVFQRLHQVEEFEGTGIGLATVRRIVERHNGRIEALGEVDQGATFAIVLPRP